MKTWLKMIRKRRVELGYDQAYMADALGVSQSAYSRIEKGQTKMDLEQFELIISRLRMAALLYIPYE